MASKKSYAVIHFKDKKSIKKNYNTSYGAFCDHKDQGCVFAELFDERGVRISSYPSSESISA
jgi:hypothetical protein